MLPDTNASTDGPNAVFLAEPIALYIHWPFCLAKCPYCDFNSHVRDIIPQARFARALRTELAWEAARLSAGLPAGARRRLGSIFFGGGTPSLMDPDTAAQLIADACALFDAVPDLEITLEANPTSVESARLQAFRNAGVNRASLGVQSLRLSFDLIYARPGQTMAVWWDELQCALDLAADHLSLYQLTIEPGTVFEGMHRRGQIVLPEGDEAAALYDATAKAAALHGLAQYEISNYARPGSQSRHNLAYWRYGDYAGIGPGAHGRVTLGGSLVATRRHRAPEIWAERVERDGHGSTAEEVITPRDRAREMLLMGLRLNEGIDEARFARRTGVAMDDAIDAEVLARATDAGYVQRGDGRIMATAEGRLRLDSLLGALVR